MFRKKRSNTIKLIIGAIVAIFLLKNLGGLIGGIVAIAVTLGILGVIALFVLIIIAALKPNKVINVDTEAKKNNKRKSRSTDVIKEDIIDTKAVEKPVQKPVEPEKKVQAKPAFTTGDPDLDKMIADKNKAIAEMHRLNDAIEDEKISYQIEHLELVTSKIVDYVVAHPDKKGQVKRLFSYYLPTTLKLLNSYDRMDRTGISGTNIDGTKDKVEDMMDTAVVAFDKQLDALFADEALDISTDISVMENLLKSEGLTDDSMDIKSLEKSLENIAD